MILALPAKRPTVATRLAAGALVIVVSLGEADRAFAAWPPDGSPVCQVCMGSFPMVVTDGTGGAFIAWQDTRNETDANIYAQRLTASGEVAPGWPVDGVALCTDPGAQFVGGPGASDGLGGFIMPWIDLRDFVPGGTLEDIYAHRILADGTFAPGWPANGAPAHVVPARDYDPVLIADGSGGAFISWFDTSDEDIYLQRLTASGQIAPGWPPGGLPVCTLPSMQALPRLAPDGAGGVLIAWLDLRDGPFAAYAQRVTAEGQIAAGWPENGVRIVLGRAPQQLASDGVGGAYLTCATAAQVHHDDYYLQRFTGNGTIAPGWPEGGVPVCLAPDERNSIGMVPDGAGGVVLVWADYRDVFDDDIFALRIRPDGTRYPGWPLDGLRVTDNTALDDFPEQAADGMGGAYLTWVQYTTELGDRVMVQHLTGAGTVAPGWPSGGAQIASDVPCDDAQIAEDGMGGAIVVWERAETTIRALRYSPGGPVAVAISVSAEAEPGRVRLTWFVADHGSIVATVERRSEAGDWERLGSVTSDGTGRLTYEDRAVSPGMRYAYRLSYAEGGAVAYTAETWVTVPAHRFALRGITPNPSAGDPVVAFSLASGEPASVELYDLSGRRVLSRDVGALGVGSHSIRLVTGGRLAAGVYTIRLRQGSNVATARAVIIH